MLGKASLARFLGGFGYIESQTTALWLVALAILKAKPLPSGLWLWLSEAKPLPSGLRMS